MTEFHVSQIDHVELFVPDRQAAAIWYGDVLGLEPLPEFAAWADLPGGPVLMRTHDAQTKIALFVGEPQGQHPVEGIRRIAFATDGAGFREFLSRLDEHPVYVAFGEQGPPRLVDIGLAYSAYFCDPWGTLLELTTYEAETVRGDLSATSG
jgi:catechol 2,3-dioxygenase-like lactoylglutathione lyase family enzyme